MVTTSKKFTLDLLDAGKGLLVAIISTVVIYVYGIVQSGSMNINWGEVLKVAVSSGLAYLIKNFFTPPKTVKTLPDETK